MIVTISTNNITMAKNNLAILQDKAGIPDVRGNIVVNDGSKGLPQIYNEAMDLWPDEDHLFMHHDVIMETNNWVDKINVLKAQHCSIIGLAGTKNFDPKLGMWWRQSDGSSFKDCYGAVRHTNNREEWTTYYGPVPKTNVECIDGLFIYVVQDVVNSPINFDTRFYFHFYDASFCLRALKMGYRIGVADIQVMHLSPGEMDETYYKAHKKFMELYGEKSVLVL